MMLLRALYLSVLTGFIATFVQAPWQLAIALAMAGLFSGFVPSAVALISVSVPDSRLNSSLSKVAGAQYIGSMVGPALGAGLAIAFGFRGAIFAASIIPLVAGTAVLFLVPTDEAARNRRRRGNEPPAALAPFRISFQFGLAVFVLFMVFGLGQLIRLATPIALRSIGGSDDVEGVTGLAFTLGGLASTISVLFVAPRLFQAGSYRPALAVASVIAAVGMLVLAFAWERLAFVGGFILVTLALSAMLPATNTLIAASVDRSRRGTAFGVAGSAQAVSLMAGPAAAAAFAAISLEGGFLLLALLLVLMGLWLLAALREPSLARDATD
jgi:DHA1 family multidrug resistance protein-like MFS transporter